MRTFTRIVFLLVTVFLGWKAFLFLFPSDETRIRKKLTRLESLVSYAPNTSPLVHLASASGILEMFSPDAALNIQTDAHTWNMTGRNEIKTSVLASRQQEPSGMQISITDPVFEVKEEGTITTLVTVTAKWSSNPDPVVRILEFSWAKGERSQWLIESIKTRKDLEWGSG
ncbi:MAG: hypothetical protein HOH33_17500 [Verrucomicrobia bacterium]|nr:hypothetical protein [Verrucomicrobiota bacterium]